MKRMIAVDGLCICVYNGIRAEVPSHKFSAKQISAGAAIFARKLFTLPRAHMADPEGAFDLRTFPHDQHSRFVNSVTNGKNSMPPWEVC